MKLRTSKEAMNPEEMSKLFQDIEEAKAAGKEIVYVSWQMAIWETKGWVKHIETHG